MEGGRERRGRDREEVKEDEREKGREAVWTLGVLPWVMDNNDILYASSLCLSPSLYVSFSLSVPLYLSVSLSVSVCLSPSLCLPLSLSVSLSI